MKKITISVGIPAFNESANIVYVVADLLEQKLSKGTLVEIIVVSDGSTDSTVQLVKSLRHKRIKVIDGKKKLGKNSRLNHIFRMFKGDLLILLDADIKIDRANVLEEMVKVYESKKPDLIAGNAQPVRGKTYVEKGINNFVYALNFVKARINHGNNIYSIRGPIVALSRSFARQIVLPQGVPDDRYLYLLCKLLGLKFSYVEKARVWYRSPQTVKDQMSQGARFRKDKENLYNHFSKDFIDGQYTIPMRLRPAIPAIQVLRSPIAYAVMKFMHAKILIKNSEINFNWDQAVSTKMRVL